MRKFLSAVVCAIALMAMSHQPAPAQAPVSSRGPIESKLSEGATTPTRIDDEIEASATASRNKGEEPAARYRKFVVSWADDAAEYGRMARYSVMLLTVITQQVSELPIARAYIRAGKKDIALRKIWSSRRDMPASSNTARMFGRYREDALILVPGGMMMRDGAVLVDLTKNRKGMGVIQLPSTKAKELASTFPHDDPARGAKPDPAAFKTFMDNNFPGFPVPKL